MLEEEVQEELKIMVERGRSAVDQETFRRPISELCRRTITAVDENARIGPTVRLMQEKTIGAVAITRGGKLSGILTERDVFRKVLSRWAQFEDLPVTEIMTANPTFLQKNDSIVFLMNKMYTGGFRHVPIVDEKGVPLHMVAVRDVFHFFFEHFPPELINVPSEPFRGVSQEYGG